MKITAIPTASPYEALPFCPNCGSYQCDDNRIDDRLYVEAAREAEQFRYDGNIDDAVEVLSALYAIQIINFLRLRWYCLKCGISFDD
jgi:ribosomal protein S27AE